MSSYSGLPIGRARISRGSAPLDATVRGDEYGDGRPAIGCDFVAILRSRLIKAGDKREIGSLEKCGKQARDRGASGTFTIAFACN